MGRRTVRSGLLATANPRSLDRMQNKNGFIHSHPHLGKARVEIEVRSATRT